ncbi:hypothetical protein Xen7305DRAFT_00006900 [Xenococcus sp. PCC 7305]|uniref:FG-GAP repeat domain-containing protein n=1 Tax=Xenococcus sp. PCC 7305 TaxID=102125 RepID=UPI0002ACB0DE|nr:VCBS repeat-containing protein [Xenococcus sp. PCC 7305]ELS00989.1 hypothetical protein Xen7305DRAFT_00006900 [Xenococcus sp. PCC 7305]
MDITFSKQIVDTSMDNTHAVVAADFDGDNDIDLASTNFILDYVAWYANDGSQNFSKLAVDGDFSGSLDGSNLQGAYPINIGDINQDGNIDILATGYEADATVWYENDGAGNFLRRDVDLNADGAHSIVPGDIDLDGDIDLLTTNQDAGTVTWYENDGGENFALRVIDDSLGRAKYADFADIDGDGDLDVFAAGNEENIISWYANDGSQNFTKQIIDNNSMGAYFVFATDLNRDGFVDVVTASQLDHTIAWYQNDGNANFTKQVIDNEALDARSVYVVDLDDDGTLDVLSASVDDDTVSWYQHDGNGNFSQQIIDDFADGAYGVFAADVDGDGLTDVLSAGRDDFTIAWYRQTREPNNAPEVLNLDTDLVIAEELANKTIELLSPISRFQNTQVPGTFLYLNAGEQENINQNFVGNFVDEGIAFNAALEPDDDLIALFRLQNNDLPGTFLYVGEDERNSIITDPEFADKFTDQGISFYVYGAGAGEETPFFRFQNSDVPGTYVYAAGAEADDIRNNLTNFIEEGIAFEAEISN